MSRTTPFTPVPEVGLQRGGFLTSRSDIVQAERSPGKTGFFALLLIGGLALSVYAVVDPDALREAVSDGRRRQGLAVLGAFALGPVLAVLGVVGLIWWSRRWRVPGGGKLVDAWTLDFDHADPERVWRVLETAASAHDPELVSLVADLTAERAQPRSRHQVWVKHSPHDRLMVGIVVTKIPKKADDPQGGLRSQLDREPVVRRGDDYVDFTAVAAPV